jgi:hypothetical protein
VWKEGLDQLIPLILSTRLLPRTLKICGRTLIPKPGKTDRRPISLFNALDSYIDTLVNRHLSSTVEKLNILDESIAAYRPGKSCTDVTLKHITAVEDVHQHQNQFLAQIDEDKAKYFDRITPELQMLPFLLAGFPPDGYIEWIAESLSDLTIDINTTQGNCHTKFLCGVRQGSALSCTIANMLAWLCTSIWDNPSPPDTHPSETNPQSGFTPTHLHPTDASTQDRPIFTKSTYCDDANKVLSSDNIEHLIALVRHNLTLSGHISIVTKMSINASKSHIRFYNVPPTFTPPDFTYTAWNYTARTVTSTNPVTPYAVTYTTPDPTDLPPPHRLFGVYVDLNGDTSSNPHRFFHALRTRRRVLIDPHLTLHTAATLYHHLVLSICSFNSLAIPYTLEKCLADDTQAVSAIRRVLGHHISDPLHLLYLPMAQYGSQFPPLTCTILEAKARELMVHLCSPRLHHITSLTITLRSRAWAAVHTPSTTPNLTLNSMLELAKTGIYCLDMSTPLINKTLTDTANVLPHHHKPLGATPISPQNPAIGPFNDLAHSSNTAFSFAGPLHRTILQTCIQDRDEEVQAYPPFDPPTDPHPHPHILTHDIAATKSAAKHMLAEHYHRTSYFLQYHPPLDPPTPPIPALGPLCDPKHWYYIAPTDPQQLRSDTFKSTFATFLTSTHLDPTSRDTTPLPSYHTSALHPEQNHTSIPHSHHSTFNTIVNTHRSPIVIASDSGYSSLSKRTTATATLCAFDNVTDPLWTTKPAHHLLTRTHLLPGSIGTEHTQNNHGEAHGFSMAFELAPLHLPAIFIIDTRTVFDFLIDILSPTAKTDRQLIKQSFPSISNYYASRIAYLLHRTYTTIQTAHPILPFDLADLEAHTHTAVAAIAGHPHTDIVDICTLDILQFTNTTAADPHMDTPPNSHSPTTWRKRIHIFRAHHHYFVHINSHQLTDAGHLKAAIPIPKPNYATCYANYLPDAICTKDTRIHPDYRFTHHLTPQPSIHAPHSPKDTIPQPPILTAQYGLIHNGQYINGDIKQYIRTCVAKAISIRYAAHRQGWLAHHHTELHDPHHQLAHHPVVLQLLQGIAPNHVRLLQTNDHYHKTSSLAPILTPLTSDQTSPLSCEPAHSARPPPQLKDTPSTSTVIAPTKNSPSPGLQPTNTFPRVSSISTN